MSARKGNGDDDDEVSQTSRGKMRCMSLFDVAAVESGGRMCRTGVATSQKRTSDKSQLHIEMNRLSS